MTALAAVGSFTMPAGTGNFSVTGVGFQGKAVLFWASLQTADGTLAAIQTGIGMAASSSARSYLATYQVDALSGSSLAATMQENTKCLGVGSYNGFSWSKNFECDFVSFDADGFTLNASTNGGTAYVVNYLVLGGTDLTNADVLTYSSGTTTGNETVTTTFAADCVLVLGQQCLDWFQASGSLIGSTATGLGWATSAAARRAAGYRDPGSTTNAYRSQATALVYTGIGTTGAAADEFDFVSTSSTTLVLNHSTASGSARVLSILALKGLTYAVGTLTQPASTGSQSVTGLAVTPKGLLLLSDNDTTTGYTTAAKLSLGAGSSASARSTLWQGGDHGGSARKTILDRANIVKLADAASTPTVTGAADLTSLDASGGFTLNWGAADGTQRQLGYLVLGGAAAVDPFPAGYGHPFGASGQGQMQQLLAR